jgi:DHA1 family tetracycline resistance protein-like MFS transporter
LPGRPKRFNALIFIFITLTINAMGIGLMMPVMPSLLTELTSLPVGEAALWGGWLSVVFASMQFLFGPTLGSLSDRFGRRPVLLISTLTVAADYLLIALSWSLAVLFIARMISGIAGATYSAGAAYIADISEKEDRAKNFGLLGAAFGVGFVLGPVIGGLLGEYGSRAPFYAGAALSFLNFLFGYFVLPETLKPENRRVFNRMRANPFGALKHISSNKEVRVLLLALLLFDIAHYVYPAVWSYFTAEVFAWTPADIGLSLAVVGFGYAFVQGYLIRVLDRRIGIGAILMIGLTCNLIAFVALSIAESGWVAYAFIGFAVTGALATPAFTGLMSNQVPDNAQGELQGLIASAAGLAMIISPFVMTQSFSFFTRAGTDLYVPGIPFVIAAVLISLSGLIALPFLNNQRIASANTQTEPSQTPVKE